MVNSSFGNEKGIGEKVAEGNKDMEQWNATCFVYGFLYGAKKILPSTMHKAGFKHANLTGPEKSKPTLTYGTILPPAEPGLFPVRPFLVRFCVSW